MKRRPNRELAIFSISALDLFASALGAFILITVILFPYYLKTSTTKVTVRGIDVVYVIDTTSSMGAAVSQIKSSLAGIVAVLKEMAPRVRVGLVAYKSRDQANNEYAIISKELTDTDAQGLAALKTWVVALKEQGGGTEIMLDAVRKARAMAWSDGGLSLIVIVADEPGAATELSALVDLARDFAAGGRRQVSAHLPPLDPSTKFTPEQNRFLASQRKTVAKWFRQISTAGKGRFVAPEDGDLASTTLLSALEVARP